MNELIGRLRAIDWVAVSLFLSAVVILLFVGGICSMFMSKSPSVFLPMEPPPTIPSPDLKLNHPQRRKHDRKNR